MSKKLKTRCLFICFLLIFAIIYPCKKNIEASELNKGVEIICVSNDNEIKSLENMESLLNGDFANKEFVEIKEPISVYNADSNDIFFIYPVYEEDECNYVVESDRSGNVILSDNTEIINELSKLESGKYLIYIVNGKYYAESSNIIKSFHQVYVNKFNESSFFHLLFEQKVSFVQNMVDNSLDYSDSSKTIKKIDVTSQISQVRSVISGYDNGWPSYKCNITNFVTQGNYNLCWSATATTIVNYKKGTTLNAKYFADKYHINYDNGSTLEQTRTCLQSFGLSYTLINTRINWEQIKSNINNDKPFVIRLDGRIDETMGHQITGYGYACSRTNSSNPNFRKIYAWDSNGYQISFLDSAATITTSGITFIWNRSLY